MERCPTACAGGEKHTRYLGNPKDCQIPENIWKCKPEGYSAYHCSYCGFIWFKKDCVIHPVGFYNSFTKPLEFFEAPNAKVFPPKQRAVKRNDRRKRSSK